MRTSDSFSIVYEPRRRTCWVHLCGEWFVDSALLFLFLSAIVSADPVNTSMSGNATTNKARHGRCREAEITRECENDAEESKEYRRKSNARAGRGAQQMQA